VLLSQLRKKRTLAALAAAALIPLSSASVISRDVRASGQRAATKPRTSTPVIKEQAMPFRPGETLNYRIAWSMFSSAASVQLVIPERRDLFGFLTWHFRAQAHTQSPVRSLFLIDDQFDSYTDANTLESRQYETRLDEMGRKTNQVLLLVPSGQISKAPGPSVVVAPGTRDPLGAFYTLRGIEWARTAEFRSPVYDGRDVYEMRAQRESPSEAVKVDGGSFSASRVSIRVFQHQKEVQAIHFVVWIANDAARTPVQIQAELPFGSLRAELTSAPQ
jgi:hypothetical protein